MEGFDQRAGECPVGGDDQTGYSTCSSIGDRIPSSPTSNRRCRTGRRAGRIVRRTSRSTPQPAVCLPAASSSTASHPSPVAEAILCWVVANDKLPPARPISDLKGRALGSPRTGITRWLGSVVWGWALGDVWGWSARPVYVGSVVNPQDLDQLLIVVDLVDHPIRSPTSCP